LQIISAISRIWNVSPEDHLSSRQVADAAETVGCPRDQTDYINAAVTFFPTTNQSVWWLNIVRINGKEGPPYMSGIASNPKEIAHKLCYFIHQEKIARR